MIFMHSPGNICFNEFDCFPDPGLHPYLRELPYSARTCRTASPNLRLTPEMGIVHLAFKEVVNTSVSRIGRRRVVSLDELLVAFRLGQEWNLPDGPLGIGEQLF